jgi:hypothetical protein
VKQRRWNRRLLSGIVSGLLTVACSATAGAQSSSVSSILAALKDSITKGGEATRLVAPPVRSYQRPPLDGAVAALGAILGLPARPNAGPASCRWAPVDSAAVGMDITVTEFEVIGDSAKVSVMRQCQEVQRGRKAGFEFEPTWFLHRRNGRWVVTATWIRVTALPSSHAVAVA